MYRYMISFSYKAPNGIGFMGFEWPCNQPIRSMDDINTIINELRSQGYIDALVLGFSLFTDPHHDPDTPAVQP